LQNILQSVGVINFIADRTAAHGVLGYWHDTVVCLSVTLCIVIMLSVGVL